MKRFGALLCLAAFALNVLTPVSAMAGQWRQDEIRWQKSSVGSPSDPTAIYVRDTVKTVVAASILDTTRSFSASDADVWPGNGVGTASADTSVVGFIVIQSDTTAAQASTISSITYEVDGRAVGMGVVTDLAQGWTQVDSTAATFAVGVAYGGTYVLPIRVSADNFLTTGTLGAINDNRFFRMVGYDALRLRITATTGVMGAARVFWRWWDED